VSRQAGRATDILALAPHSHQHRKKPGKNVERGLTVKSGMTRRSLLVITVVLTAGCAGAASRVTRPLAVRHGHPVYDGTVVIDPSSRRLQARWRIDFLRTAAMRDSATLLFNSGLNISSLTGPGISGYDERNKDDEKMIIVRFAQPAPDITVPSRIDIAYEGVPVFGTDTINGIGARWIELGLDSYWHPVFSDYAHLITGRVHIVLPSGWRIAASGSVLQRGDTLTLTNAVPLIDIAFSASPDLAFTERGNARVYYAGPAPAIVPMILDITTACTNWLDAHYGASNKLPPTRMVFAPRGGPGYARKNYIVITNAADTSRINNERFICHELAHYWSSGAISSGPENWLNEAFAEYVAGRYIRDAHGEPAYASIVLKRWQTNSANAGPIWTSTATRRPTARAAYNKAPALLDQLESRVRRPAMESIVRRYMTEGIHTTTALLDLIANVAGADAAAWFREQLASK
jgi:hypothetical protein